MGFFVDEMGEGIPKILSEPFSAEAAAVLLQRLREFHYSATNVFPAEFEDSKDIVNAEERCQHAGVKRPLAPSTEAVCNDRVCPFCEKTFRFPNELKRHVEGVHKGIKFECSECKKTFTTKCNLNKHVKATHLGQKYPCEVCKKEFSDRSNLRKHVKSVHEKQRFQCKLCPKSFTQSSHLNTHVRSFHEKIRVACPCCTKDFSRKDHLQSHLKTCKGR